MLLNPYFFNLSENPRVSAGSLLRDTGAIETVPVNLVKLCKKQDWNLVFVDFNDERDAMLSIDGDNQITISINTDESEQKGSFSKEPTLLARQRFSMAHEIGHACLKSHTDSGAQQQLNSRFNPHGRRYERTRESQANEFAAELLIPQSHLEVYLKSFGWDTFFAGSEKISESFEVSMLAAANRAAKEAPFPAMLLFFNPNGRLHQVPARSRYHADTGFFFEQKGLIPKRTLVDDLANKPDCNTRLRRYTDCTAWFPTSAKAKDYQLAEQSIRLGKYGFLTFLSFTEKEIEY